MLGLLIELEKTGNVILSSDAIYTKDNVGPPIRLPGIMYDSLGYASTVKFLTDLAKKRSAQIWYGHDRVQFAGLIKSQDGFYE
jgi:glyoxylase-like metal-dependent hydrolase (beta-lactamase superfamily II)